MLAPSQRYKKRNETDVFAVPIATALRVEREYAMDLRFVERKVDEFLNTGVIGAPAAFVKRTVHILQFRDGPSSAWQDVPLAKDDGTDSTLAKNV